MLCVVTKHVEEDGPVVLEQKGLAGRVVVLVCLQLFVLELSGELRRECTLESCTTCSNRRALLDGDNLALAAQDRATTVNE